MDQGKGGFLESLNRAIERWHAPVFAASAFVLGIIVAWHVLTLATPLGTAEVLLIILCLAGLAAGLWVRGGEMRLQSAVATLAVYAGGFAASLAVYNAIIDPSAPIPEWQVWLMFTAVFVLVYRWLQTWFKPSRRLEAMTEDERIEYLAAKAAGARRRAELKALPSNGWYELASFVTGAAMVGSFATTAIGFYHEIVDPLDPPLVQYGIPVGLSALAALIIWAGWNFVFLRIRTAGNTISRLFGLIVGLIVLVPLTLAIHTVFGIIGVGGTEGLRAHNLWYADVLDAYERRVDGIRAIEASRLDGALSYMSNQLKAAAANEETTGQGCGAGRGSLFTFYTDSAARTQTILDVVTNRKNANQDIKSEVEALRARIRKPGRQARRYPAGARRAGRPYPQEDRRHRQFIGAPEREDLRHRSPLHRQFRSLLLRLVGLHAHQEGRHPQPAQYAGGFGRGSRQQRHAGHPATPAQPGIPYSRREPDRDDTLCGTAGSMANAWRRRRSCFRSRQRRPIRCRSSYRFGRSGPWCPMPAA